MKASESLKLIEGYDWTYAFEYAGPSENKFVCGEPCLDPVVGYTGDLSPFTRADVKKVIAADDGENDGPPWIALMCLKDGRFAFLSAGCDYTGWDCQAGGSVVVGDDLKHLIKFGLAEEDRRRLKLGEFK